MRLVLFEPDIPQNTGTMMRLASALGVPMDIIEPCGFIFDDRRVRRAGMDYIDHLDLTRHASWGAYLATPARGRLVLATTKASVLHTEFAFSPDDRIMVGRESSGVPDEIADGVDARVRVPMRPHARSLNVAVTAAILLSEALRRTGGFPVDQKGSSSESQ